MERKYTDPILFSYTDILDPSAWQTPTKYLKATIVEKEPQEKIQNTNKLNEFLFINNHHNEVIVQKSTKPEI